MRFCELETDLQNKLLNAIYCNSIEIKSIINGSLEKSNSTFEFKKVLATQIEILLEEISEVIADVYEYNNIES